MQVRSLAYQTNLMFARFSGSVIDRGSHLIVQTPGNPGYHWGNYVIFDRPPVKGDLVVWTELFKREFPYYREPQHYVFAWEESAGARADCQEFLDAGFVLDSAVVLTASAGARSLVPPPRPNSRIEVRKIASEREWRDVIELQNLCADPKYINDYYSEFKERQMAQYRKMSEAGLGHWFGAYLEGRVVGDLGIFCEGSVGRYQSVGTHPEFRRRGVCGTLVHHAGSLMMKERGLSHLVMEADPEYHAARIYESVGFRRAEINHSLSWWRSSATSIA